MLLRGNVSRSSKSRPRGFLFHNPAIVIVPDVACIQFHELIYHFLISDRLSFALIKTAINKQLFLRRRTRPLELGGRQWWWVGTVRRG